MSEVTDLHILAKMSYGTTNDEDAFIIKDSKGKKILYKIHNLKELVEVLTDLPSKNLFPYLCRMSKEEELMCDIALWVHYILGDATLSAKIYNLVEEFKGNPEQLKLEVFNFCFNRYLNFQEILEYADFLPLKKTPPPPSNI